MRIGQLDLHCWGPFPKSFSLHLDPERPRLHLIFGENEAGKSSTLEAIECLLFGIPRDNVNTQTHLGKDLLIGATLLRGDGKTLTLVRRKARSDADSLKSPAGERIELGELRAFLGGIDHALFRQLFGLSHQSMRSGAERLLSRDDADEGVLVAGPLQQLRSRQLHLTKIAKEFFLRKGSKPKLNQALNQIKATQEALHARHRDGATYDEQVQAFEALNSAIEQAQAQVDDLEVSKHRRATLRDAEPWLAKLHDHEERLRALGALPTIDADAHEQLRAAHHESERIAAELPTRNAELDELRSQLESLDAERKPSILALAEPIERLRAQALDHLAAIQALPAKSKRRDEAQAQIRSLALDSDPALLEGDGARLDDFRNQCENLDREREANIQQRQVIEQRMRASEQLLEDADDSESQAAHGPLIAILQAELEVAAEVQQRKVHRAAECSERDEIDEFLAVARQSWSAWWSGSLEALCTAALPSPAQLEEDVASQQEAESALGRAEDALAAAQTQLQTIRDDRERVREDAAVPAEGALEAQREVRDATWRELRDRVLEPGSATPTAPELDDFERTQASADEVADACIRTSAERESLRQSAKSEREAERRCTQLRAARDRAAEGVSAAQEAFAQRWSVLDQRPERPEALRPLLAELPELARRLARRAALNDAQARLQSAIDEAHRALLAVLPAGSVQEETESSSLEGLIAAGRLHCERLTAEQAAAHQRAEARAAAREDLAAATVQLGQHQDALQSLNDDWAARTSLVGLPSETSIELLRGRCDALRRGRALIDECSALERDIAEAEAIRATLEAELEYILGAGALGMSRADLNPDIHRALDALIADLNAAQKAEEQVDSARASVVRAEAELRRVQDQDKAAATAIARLHEQAGTSGDAELRAAIQRDQEARELKASIGNCRDQLAPLALRLGTDLDGLEQGLAKEQTQLSEDAAAALQVEIDALRATITTKSREAGALRTKIDQLDATDFTELSQQLATERAEAAELARSYLVASIAARLASEVLARRAKRDRDPVLERAGALFPRLTGDRYEQLALDWKNDKPTEEHLVAIEATVPGGVPVRRTKEQLSDGTRDQMFLALRLGHIQHRAEQSEPFPIILDDILVHTDESRAAAVLQTLAEVARTSQVLLFTHQARVVEIARTAVKEQDLAVHDLAALARGKTASEEASDAAAD